MLKAVLIALTLLVVASAEQRSDSSYYSGSSQLSTYRKIIKEQSRQIDELLELNQKLTARLKACDTPRIASSDSDYSSRKTVQSSRSSTDKYQSSRDSKDSREYSRDSRDYKDSRESRDYNREYSRDSRLPTNFGFGGLGIDPILADQLFASSMMPMYRPLPPQQQPIYGMNSFFPPIPSSRGSFAGPSFRPTNQRKEKAPKETIPISLEPLIPEPISCNQVQELEEEKTSQDQSGHEIKIKYESSTCSCEAERHCRFSYSSFNPETCVKQELNDQTLTNCDLLTQCIEDERCDGILHDNGQVYKISCSGDNTVSTVLADPHQFVIQIKNCL